MMLVLEIFQSLSLSHSRSFFVVYLTLSFWSEDDENFRCQNLRVNVKDATGVLRLAL